MKFLVPNYSCLQNPWLGDYHPQIPVLSVLNWICWTPPPKKIPGYATDCGSFSHLCFHSQILEAIFLHMQNASPKVYKWNFAQMWDTGGHKEGTDSKLLNSKQMMCVKCVI